jgi:hypothetical protein
MFKALLNLQSEKVCERGKSVSLIPVLSFQLQLEGVFAWQDGGYPLPSVLADIARFV